MSATYWLIQFALEIGALLPAADLLPLEHFDVVREASHDEHVRELRAEAEVGLRGLPIGALTEELRLLRRVGGEERRVVPVLLVREPDEALLRELVLASLGEADLGGDLRLQRSHRLVLVQRQVLHRAAGLRADDVRAPPELGEAVRDPGGHREGRWRPEVLVVAVHHVLGEVEGLHRDLVLAVGQPEQEPRHAQADVAGVLALPEALPPRVLRALEERLEVLEIGELEEALLRTEELR
jgi:hypothetical protein